MSSSTIQPYLILACSSADEPKELIHTVLQSRVCEKNKYCDAVYKFDVPENLKFGSFDSLIRLVDDLSKQDSQVEAVLRRIERQLLELDPKTEFKVVSQRSSLSCEEYISKFHWDDAKFPRTRNIQDNLSLLLTSIQKLDEEVKSKSQTFSDLKTQYTQMSKKDAGSYAQRDLTDVVTPKSVRDGDFVETEHLTTVVVVVPRGQDQEFLSKYEAAASKVVPQSAIPLNLPADKDGAKLYRVVVFKNSVEEFSSNMRHARFNCRDFTYDAAKYDELQSAKAHMESEVKKQEAFLKRVCAAAFSDTLVGWMHLKAMRTFVEAVLRFGVPPNFAAFIAVVGKKSQAKPVKLRAELMDVFSSSGLFGKNYLSGAKTEKQQGSAATDEEGSSEYYPYVSLSFSPLVSAKAGSA
ncbi:hypothetical protein FOZ62_009431 [Perkinsus olseni]|uniref:V-type proton ATPase subunit C n=1 Tax=Perkinsus olseni TaxID=32597 RepID=A0A7J6UGA9_PEROL|nr:hypothetical protein FOZ62_009431 [Perkinsus olseni]